MLKIRLNGEEYPVSEAAVTKLAILVSQEVHKVYEKELPEVAKTLIDQLIRKKLYDMEKQIFAATGDVEKAKSVRPAPKQSPTEKLLESMQPAIEDKLQYVEIGISTDDNGNISDFTYQFSDTSQAG